MAQVTAVGLRVASTSEQQCAIRDDVAARRFGVDIDWQGDFTMTGNGDLKLVSGLPAFRARFERALLTVPGELLGWPEWGIGIIEFLSQPATEDAFFAIRERIERFLLSEPHVSAVGRIEVSMSANRIDLVVPMQIDEGPETVRVSLRRAG